MRMNVTLISTANHDGTSRSRKSGSDSKACGAAQPMFPFPQPLCHKASGGWVQYDGHAAPTRHSLLPLAVWGQLAAAFQRRRVTRRKWWCFTISCTRCARLRCRLSLDCCGREADERERRVITEATSVHTTEARRRRDERRELVCVLMSRRVTAAAPPSGVPPAPAATRQLSETSFLSAQAYRHEDR